MTALEYLNRLPAAHDAGRRVGITSVCSAHPLVIEAALLQAGTGVALIEATCNQVNQDGGYTGMTPAGFRAYVLGIAARVEFPADNILFGGDHLGPNPWRKLSADQAMAKALVMTEAYAAAGFAKIHLDASMACAGDPDPLPPATIATRSALLAQAAERGAAGLPAPSYIIGTEVPVPGGAHEELGELVVTTPQDAATTLALHKDAFAAVGLTDAYARVVGLVVQPGVEFGHANVIGYQPAKATSLSTFRDQTQGVVFEAHSTDYQTTAALTALVQGGFAILKVGPGLTFALREALYGLDQIAGWLTDYPSGSLPSVMEGLLLDHPSDWAAYYHGTPTEQRLQRHFSYSDRIRYYWNNPKAQAAVDRLLAALAGQTVPETLISQYLPRLYPAVIAGEIAPDARALTIAAIRVALAPYSAACAATP
ncbi:MAG: D-tagatose-bisphosphate aldolase, class II, non-catalytic subunit [Paracoccaceae bacterium]